MNASMLRRRAIGLTERALLGLGTAIVVFAMEQMLERRIRRSSDLDETESGSGQPSA
ncbi:hypothetical protein D3C83_266970 [compost metagenome]